MWARPSRCSASTASPARCWEGARNPGSAGFPHRRGVAAATPATDGKRVVLFCDYGLITTDLDGNKLWEHRFVTSTGNQFSYGASPIIEGDKLLLNRDGALNSARLF